MPSELEAGASPSRQIFPPEVLQQLAEDAPVREVGERTILFRRGDRAEGMFIVEEGSVEIHLEGAGTVVTLGPGELLGDLALLTESGRRSATAVTATPCRLRAIGRARFDSLLEEHPDVAGRALQHACAYLLEGQLKLVDDLRARNAELERALDYMRRTKDERDAAEVRAQTDELTGIYNRRCLNEQLPKFIERARRGGQGLALLAMDLDRFKPINDTHGHAAGDLVLQAVARVLKGALRATDLPCRVGGDEFTAVVWPASEAEAQDMARDLQRAVSSTEIHAPEGCLRVGATVGATAWRPGDDPAALMARADEALYAAKEGGRNCVAWDGRILESR